MTKRISLKWSTTWYYQTWENTDIKRLAQRKKKAFTKYWSDERDKHKNHLIRLEKQMKQETRVYFIGNLMDILDPATDFNAKRFYIYVKCQEKDGSRLPMYSM